MSSSSFSGFLVLAVLFFLLCVRRKRIAMGNSPLVQVVPDKVLEDVGRRVLAKQPSTIHLLPQASWTWLHASEVSEMSQGFLSLGFQETATCTIQELPDVALKFFLHQEDRCYATVYEHKKAGCWMNCISLFEDGSSLTVSSSKSRGLNRNPLHALIHVPGGTPAALVEAARPELHGKAKKLLSGEGILQEFESAWAEEIKWREANPISAKEVLAVAQTRDAQEPKPLVIDFLGGHDGNSENELKGALRLFFENNRSVQRAYLARAKHEGCPTPVVALCVAVGKNKDFDLLQEIHKLVASSASQIDMILDVLMVDEHQEERLKLVCSPFYEKNSALNLH